MKLFGGRDEPKAPSTISDDQMADLRRRANSAHPDWFSKKAVNQRIQSTEQNQKRHLS